jgi:hypothetical protein
VIKQHLLRRRLGVLAATVLMTGLGLAATATAASAATAAPAVQSATAAKVQPAGAVRPLAGAFNPIRNVGDGKCLQPTSTADVAPVVQITCNGSLIQNWAFLQVATNHYRFLNQLSGLCFDAFDGAFNGARLLQGECKAISNEEFNTGASLPNVTKIETRVHFNDNGFCVDVPGASPAEGLPVQIFQCNGTLAQRWVIGFA